jgi:uncharacterized repeat protein (TIGR03803 family)
MTKITNYAVIVLALFALIVALAAMPAYAQTYSVLYNFGTRGGDPANPFWTGNITEGWDGNLYTTATQGGVKGNGAVFRMSPEGKLYVLYDFCAQTNCTDGTVPRGGLTLGYDGNFYGTTYNGGTDNGGQGTLFRITPTRTYTVLHSFGPGLDGAFPESAPTQGDGDILYGSTQMGGTADCGTIYTLTLQGAYSVLYSFGTTSTDGCYSVASPISASDGNLYGTTNLGGTSGDGTVYRITPSGQETVIYNFDGTHGSQPWGPLVEGTDGNFYGTTLAGGTANAGVIFKVTPAGAISVLHSMNGTTDGNDVHAGLVQGTDGNFYGVAQNGGETSETLCSQTSNDQCGTLFEITPAGTFTVIYSFDGTHGFSPLVAPFQHTNGLIFGDTFYGGTGTFCIGDRGIDLCGVFYQLDANLPAYVGLTPYRGNAGRLVQFVGQGFTSATTVSFNGVAATATIVSGTHLAARVPTGATTGYVTVTTSSGTLTSNMPFVVTP